MIQFFLELNHHVGAGYNLKDCIKGAVSFIILSECPAPFSFFLSNMLQACTSALNLKPMQNSTEFRTILLALCGNSYCVHFWLASLMQ